MARKPLNTSEQPAPAAELPQRGGLYERQPDGTLQLLEATEQSDQPAATLEAPTPPAAAPEGEG